MINNKKKSYNDTTNPYSNHLSFLLHYNNKKNPPLTKNNSKKMLCNNILNNKICKYKYNCVYAHSLAEQKIDSIRHKVYTILNNTTNLSNIDLMNDVELFNTFMLLTKVCAGCAKHICPGGYNCRNGAISNKYKICYDDIIFGTCKRTTCKFMHLTNRGLRPYSLQSSIFNNRSRTRKQHTGNFTSPQLIRKRKLSNYVEHLKMKEMQSISFTSCPQINNFLCKSDCENFPTHKGVRTSFVSKTSPDKLIKKNIINKNPWKNKFKQKSMIDSLRNHTIKNSKVDIKNNSGQNISYIPMYKYNKQYKDNLNEIKGIQLTDNFFLRYLSKKHHNDYTISTDSDSMDENVDEIIKYLNNHSDEEEH